jgi:hypothetical protein
MANAMRVIVVVYVNLAAYNRETEAAAAAAAAATSIVCHGELL